MNHADRRDAIQLFGSPTQVSDRLWLHYGMTLLAYDFFRLGAIAIGQLSRYQDGITPKEIKKRLTAEMGQLGAVEKATDRIMFSLRDWGILGDADQRYVYRAQRRHFAASTIALEAWLLTAHPADELPFTDMLRLPEVFPFRFSLTVDYLRNAPGLKSIDRGLVGTWLPTTPGNNQPTPFRHAVREHLHRAPA